MAKIILVEIKPGIDMLTSSLVQNPDYWAIDENERAIHTDYEGTLSTNYWQISGTRLIPNDAGSASAVWTLSGTRLILK